MYYIIKKDVGTNIALSDVELADTNRYETDEFLFKAGDMDRFVIPTLDVEFVFGTDDIEEWETHIFKLKQSDEIVYRF